MTAKRYILQTDFPHLRLLPKRDAFLANFDGKLDPKTVLFREQIAPPKQYHYMVKMFALWLIESGEYVLLPDFSAFWEDLLNQFSPGNAYNHILAIAHTYEALTKDRDFLFSTVVSTDDWFQKKQLVDELVVRIGHGIEDKLKRHAKHVIQDQPDQVQRRLLPSECHALLDAPNPTNALGKRDRAVIALLLCTGIRIAELVHLMVGDLRQQLNGELALHVRHGKGNKSRLVPYGDMSYCLDYVDDWLHYAGIESGYVFRGLKLARGGAGYVLRDDGRSISTHAARVRLQNYPIPVTNESEPVKIKPHDLRRTYALNCYNAGMDIYQIQLNMGHADSVETRKYIGKLDGWQRRPPDIYQYSSNPSIKHNRSE